MDRVYRKRQSKTEVERDAPLNRLRNDVLDASLRAAALVPVFFSLTVPTGGPLPLSLLMSLLRCSRQNRI